MVVGVVNCPILDELYTAVKGKGAFCNDKKLTVSSIGGKGIVLNQPILLFFVTSYVEIVFFLIFKPTITLSVNNV